MKSPRSFLGLLAATTLLASAHQASAAAFTGIFTFGDSLSDSGNTNLISGGLRPGAAYFSGRFSNGPVWVENLAAGLSLNGSSPSLLGGRNFAFGGANTSTGGLVPTISQQAAGFLGSGGSFLPTDLVVVWGGANDFFTGQTNPAIPAANISSIISTLAGAGAKNFLVPNLPDLGDTAESIASGNPLVIAGSSAFSVAFNSALLSGMNSLESSLGVTIYDLDVFSISKDIKNNPATYGFTNTTESALLTGNAANATQYVFWDGVHPTARVHEIIAQRALTLVPEPTSAFLVFITGSLVALRRRRAA
jgi:outer membrane lipase/esterase